MDRVLQIVLKVKDELSSKIDDAGKNIRGFERTFSGATSASQNFARGLGVAGVAIAGFGAFALNAASEAEQLSISFNTLLGSTEKADAFVKQMKQFAQATPFETQDIAKAAQTMLSFGIAADKIMPSIQMIGDVSLGNQEKFSGLSLAFAQVQATGRLMGQDLLQMINQGFNPLQIISEKTGKSMGELKAQMEKGGISAQMVTDAFKTATSEGGRFFGGMEAQSKSLSGIMSTLKDVVGENVKEIGEKFLPIIKEAGQALINFSQNQLPQIIAAIGNFTNFLKENWGIIYMVSGAIISALIPALLELIPVVWASVVAFGAAAVALAPWIIGGAIIGGIVAGIVWIVKNWDILKQKAVDNFGFIFEFLSKVFNSISETAVSIFNSLAEFFTRSWEIIKNIFIFSAGLIVGAVLKYFEFLGVDIVAIFNRLVEFYKWFFDVFLVETNENMTMVHQKWVEFWDMISKYVTEKWEKIKGIVVGGLTSIRNRFNDAIAPFKDAWSLIWTAIEIVIDGFFSRTKSKFTDFVNWIVDKLNTVINALNTVAQLGASVGGFDVKSIPNIPKLAKGGIVTKPTLALIGEAGPEAVVPLSSRVGNAAGGTNVTVIVNGDVSGDELVERVTSEIMRQLRTNTKLVAI